MIIIFYHKSWKMCPFLLLMGEQHSGEAHGGQFSILESMLWSTAKNPEDILEMDGRLPVPLGRLYNAEID